jgi:hypothetical protein
MNIYQVVIEVDDSEREKDHGIKNMFEYYVAHSINDVFLKAVESAKNYNGELIAIVKKEPVLGILNKTFNEDE